jgi:hypothetical protein
MKQISIAFLFSLLGCVSSKEQEIKLAPSINEDSQYANIYRKVTKKYEVIKNFETRVVAQITLLTKDFREALGARYQRIFNEPEPILSEATNKAGVFISIYTSNKDLNHLGDKQLWTVQLDANNQLATPVLIKNLANKPRWKPFFGGISPWTKEYLVLFDQSSPAITGLSQMVSPKTLRLILSNADGQINANW